MLGAAHPPSVLVHVTYAHAQCPDEGLYVSDEYFSRYCMMTTHPHMQNVSPHLDGGSPVPTQSKVHLLLNKDCHLSRWAKNL